MARPYRLITRIDAPDAHHPVGPRSPYRRFVARSHDGSRTVLLTAPRPGADLVGFRAEAEAAQRLTAPWLLPVTDLSPSQGPNPAEAPSPLTPDDTWFVTPYVPVLPLPVALAVHGGPLPEATVRVIGAALAETLAALHAQGVTHAGVSPAAVLLSADGPLLTCFGAARATAEVDHEAQAPERAAERAAGEPPRPAGDVYGFGAVLAYAATGHTVPERSELPESLRAAVTACLTRDPADRPTAAALLQAVAPPTPHETVLGSAATLLRPGWLPARVVAALAHQSASLLAVEQRPTSRTDSPSHANSPTLTGN
ncbi:serine/threonine protein kinase [Streptomyces sp. NPDC090025]|uniref:serine/threonine protein kinase n=1 Tax=Streptomyces sp. NPDC090025 TaxID=3365922 RepID=UPI0038339A36